MDSFANFFWIGLFAFVMLCTPMSCAHIVTPKMIERANEVCQANAGIKKIESSVEHEDGKPIGTIYCNNGANFRYTEPAKELTCVLQKVGDTCVMTN